MKLSDICHFLQQLSGKQELILSQDTFNQLTAVNLLLQQAFGVSSISLSRLTVQPEQACLDATTDHVRLLGYETATLSIHLSFWEESTAAQNEETVLALSLEVLPPDSFPSPFSKLPGQMVFSSPRYSFETLEDASVVLCNASGYLQTEAQHLPVLLTFFPKTGQIRLTLDQTTQPVSFTLKDACALLGGSALLQLLPTSFQQLLNSLSLENLTLEYLEKEQYAGYFNLVLSLPNSVSWQPFSSLSLSFCSLQLSLFAYSPAQSASQFYAEAGGQIQLESLSLPVKAGFLSNGKLILTIGDSPVLLGSLDAIQNLMGFIVDTSCLPVSSAAFYLNGLKLEYDLSSLQLTAFCLDLSVQDVWSFHGLEVKGLSFGLN